MRDTSFEDLQGKCHSMHCIHGDDHLQDTPSNLPTELHVPTELPGQVSSAHTKWGLSP